jgi:hypothetical protein
MLTKKLVPEAAALFTPLGQVVPGSKISDLPDPSGGRFLGNESASGPIPPERIEAAEALLESLATRPSADGRPLLETAFDADGLASLWAALRYCRENGLGMIEASDVVVPVGGECYTDQANMRAPFLGKMEA